MRRTFLIGQRWKLSLPIAAAAVQTYGRIDVLLNNAGLMPHSPLERLKIEDWERTIDVNLKGVLYGIAAVLPYMFACFVLYAHFNVPDYHAHLSRHVDKIFQWSHQYDPYPLYCDTSIN